MERKTGSRILSLGNTMAVLISISELPLTNSLNILGRSFACETTLGEVTMVTLGLFCLAF